MSIDSIKSRNELLENYRLAISGDLPEKIPVVLWSIGHGFAHELDIPIDEYYRDTKTKLMVQSKMQETYPDAMLMPGIYPDYGVVTEPALFGCPVLWQKQQAPAAEPLFSSIEEVDHWNVPNVASSRMANKVMDDIDYLLKHADPSLLEDYGYMQGTVFMMGPLETAAMIRGYAAFLIDLLENPERVKLLLRIVTDGLLEWLGILEKKHGTIRQLIVADHFSTQISEDHFEEFFFPYMRELFAQYPEAVRVYHNEGIIEHVMHRIPEMGASIFHFGTEMQKTSEAIGDRICLMGNLDPINLMLNSAADEVKEECLRILDIAAGKGGFLLSTAGGMSINTPPENISTLFEAVNEYMSGRKKG